MKTAGSKGFTLVETMVSLALGLLAIASVGLVLQSGVFLSSDDRSRLYAQNALKEQYETVRGMNFDALTALGGSSTFTNAQMTKLHNGSGVMAVENSFGADARKVTLRVTWRSRGSRTLTEGLTTLVSRVGVNGQ